MIIITGAVDYDGERVHPEGVEWDRYKENPVLLYMHERGKVIGRVENIQFIDGQWEGTPVFDLGDPEAAEIARKYDEGFLKGVSVWLDVSVVSEAPEHLRPGQTLPTLLRSSVMEVSIVDIPNNADTLAKKKYTWKGANVKPEEFKNSTINNESNMSKSVKKALGLKEDADDTEAVLEIQKKDKTINDQEKKIDDQEKTITALETKINDLAKDGVKKSAQILVDGAEQAGKITAPEKEEYLALAQLEGGLDRVKSLLDKKQAYKSISSQLGGTAAGSPEGKSWETKKAARSDWDYLKWSKEDSGALKYAREKDPDFFNELLATLKK